MTQQMVCSCVPKNFTQFLQNAITELYLSFVNLQMYDVYDEKMWLPDGLGRAADKKERKK